MTHESLFHYTMDANFSIGFPSSGYKSLYLERPDIDQEDVRLMTYLLWPKWVPRSINKESMAKTGLYFTGDGDQVKCFHCKVTLGDWKEGDRPFERHLSESPHCDFLRRLGHSYDDDLAVDGEYEADEDDVDGASLVQQAAEPEKRKTERLEASSTLPANHDYFVQSQKTLPNKCDKDTLKDENDKLRNAMMCRSCKRERIQTLFLPCRHLVTCEECAEKMDDCIECRQQILGTVRTFMV